MSDHIFYPDLKIVPVSHIRLQEYVHTTRMGKLAQAIEKEGMLRNPPIVTNFFNSTYLHLDGANRITALSLLKYPNSLVQIVDYSDPSHVRLMSWSHLANVDKRSFIDSIRRMKGITMKETKTFHHKMLVQPRLICMMVFSDGSSWDVISKTSAVEVIAKHIGAIVNQYIDQHVERVFSAAPWTHASIMSRFDRYPENNVFLAFPNFSSQQVIALVDQGILMPAGITRHVVYRRKLNVNLPLTYLKISPVEKANEELQKFLQHRTVRLYEEPVIYFE